MRTDTIFQESRHRRNRLVNRYGCLVMTSASKHEWTVWSMALKVQLCWKTDTNIVCLSGETEGAVAWGKCTVLSRSHHFGPYIMMSGEERRWTAWTSQAVESCLYFFSPFMRNLLLKSDSIKTSASTRADQTSLHNWYFHDQRQQISV